MGMFEVSLMRRRPFRRLMRNAPGYLFISSLAVGGLVVFTNTDMMSSIGALAQGCKIKGEVNTLTGIKTFYVPGNKGYASARVRMEHGGRFFCDEEQAIEAGFSKAKG